MAPKGTLKDRVSSRIKRSKACVFLRKDFEDMGTYQQIGCVLRQLVDEGTLIKLGYGIYARSNKSSTSNNTIPEKPLQRLAKEAMKKLGLETVPSAAELAYNRG